MATIATDNIDCSKTLKTVRAIGMLACGTTNVAVTSKSMKKNSIAATHIKMGVRSWLPLGIVATATVPAKKMARASGNRPVSRATNALWPNNLELGRPASGN